MTAEPIPGELAAALVAALGELDDIARGKTATVEAREGRRGYAYRYSDLAAVLETVRPVLARHGLAVVQDVETIPADRAVAVEVTTAVVHRSGAVHRSPLLRLSAPPDPQRVGSAITYARRYSLMATLGISAVDDDDDAAAASIPPPASAPKGRKSSAPRQTAKQPPSARTAAEQSIREALDVVTPEIRQKVRHAFREHYGRNLSELDPRRHGEALTFVTEQLDQALGDVGDLADANTAHDAAETGDPVTPESEDER